MGAAGLPPNLGKRGIVFAGIFGFVFLFGVIGLATPVFKLSEDLGFGNSQSATVYLFHVTSTVCIDGSCASASGSAYGCGQLNAGRGFGILTVLGSLVAIAAGVMKALGKLPPNVPMPLTFTASGIAGVCFLTWVMGVTLYTSGACTGGESPKSIGGSMGASPIMFILAWLLSLAGLALTFAPGSVFGEAPTEAAPGGAAPYKIMGS